MTCNMPGRYDEATPVTVQPYHDHIAGARWEIFEESSHVPNLEEPQRFREVMLTFLSGLGRPEALTGKAATDGQG